MFDFAVLAERLTEEDPVIGLAIERGFGAVEINSEHTIIIISASCKGIIESISGYIVGANSSYSVRYKLLEKNGTRNIRYNHN